MNDRMKYLIRLLWPVVLFEIITEGAEIAGKTVSSAFFGGEDVPRIILTGSAAVLTALILLIRRPKDREKMSPHDMIMCGGGGFSLAEILNQLFAVTGLAALSSGWNARGAALLDAPLAAKILVIVILVPLAEELVFRDRLFRHLRQKMGFGMAALISAAVFGAVHGDPVQGLYAAFIGFAAAAAMDFSGNFFGAFICHAMANLAPILLSALGR